MPLLSNVRILVADDHELVRRGLVTLLSSRPNWSVCAQACSGREAIALASEHRPNVVVMDIAMPGLNGLEATRKIRKMLPKTEVAIYRFTIPINWSGRSWIQEPGLIY